MQLFEELKSYVGFDAGDVETLRRLRPIVEPHIDQIADRFYESLTDNLHTQPVVDPDDQLDNLHRELGEWLQEVFGGVYDQQYSAHRKEIGQLQVEVGLKPQYMSASMNHIRVELIRLVCQNPPEMPLEEALGSIERILDIDLTLMLHGYWQALLAEKDDAGTELATRLAHEIRNPLNAIGLNLTLLDRKVASQLDNAEPFTSSLDAIRTELQRIDNLTKEIKHYSQPISPSAEWHAFDSLANDLRSAYGPTLEANDIDLEVDIQSSATDIYCDPEYLKDALVNIIENAVEAIEGGGRLTLEAGARDGHTIVEITDTGEGIEPTATERAFDLFYTTKASGTGIGLPMVKKVVEAHDGTVDVFRPSDGGTTIRMTLPRPTPPTEVN